MPKVMLSPLTSAAEIVQRNIESRGAIFGLRTQREFAKRFDMPIATYHVKKTNPRTWTLEQLTVVAQALKVSLSWLMTDHSGEIKDERGAV